MQRSSAVTTLKEVLVIITGLTMTNSIIVLIAKGNYENINSILNIDPVDYLFFILLQLNIVRFYLGNVRLLDDCYFLSFECAPSEGTNRTKNLPLDYSVVLVTGILFALLSFYLRNIQDFFVIFAIILTIDIIWFVVTWKDVQDAKIRNQRKWWTINNVSVVLPIAFGHYVPNPEASFLWLIPFFATLVNTVIDFILSWKFYFFTSTSILRTKPKVFLAAPFTQLIDKSSGIVGDQFRIGLLSIYNSLSEQGYDVFSAHVHEKWGEALEDPATALVRDLSQLRDSDVLIAFIGNPPSPGVQMELGSALTMNKPILIFLQEGAPAPYLLEGVPMTTKALCVNYKSFDDAQMKIKTLMINITKNKWIL